MAADIDELDIDDLTDQDTYTKDNVSALTARFIENDDALVGTILKARLTARNKRFIQITIKKNVKKYFTEVKNTIRKEINELRNETDNKSEIKKQLEKKLLEVQKQERRIIKVIKAVTV